ncbi:zeatin O-xylosyltransferase-like [Lycium ferocissimum]|uniref:zeatin O-xylosyltransferase-like n=1 Tax=Lycium ferocissimum TaxID=112874 RepID=UPI00281690DC|nr:zeatin O-xylosyltransferase-like [Lycium ferocissimum]
MANVNVVSSLNHSQTGIEEGGDVVVVMVPFLAQGHLNPLLHLSRLVSSYNLPIYYLGYSDKISLVKRRVHGWNPFTTCNIHFQEFPNPPSHELSHDQLYGSNKSSHQIASRFILPILDESLMLREPVGAFLLEIAKKTRRVVVIYDSLMASVVQDIVSIPNAEAFCFNVSSAFMICSMYLEEAVRRFHLPTFVGKFIGRILLPNGFQFPNNIPSFQNCFIPKFMDFILMQDRVNTFCSGNLYSTCKAVEGPYLNVLSKFNKLLRKGKQWAIGPLHPIAPLPSALPLKEDDDQNINRRHKCLKWLDKQEPNSVILVSFGTTSSLSSEQIKELAIGLEKSQQKFIWIVRDALLLREDDQQVQIPQDYEERVEGTGVVVKDWAPQLEILEHSSTGGFLSHCGWNSVLESITSGVPLATWPMLFDHPRIAVLVTKVLKIGIVVKDWEKRDELITSTTVETVVRKLMASAEGNEMRMRVIELSKKVRQSMIDGGDYTTEMDSFIAHITRC